MRRSSVLWCASAEAGTPGHGTMSAPKVDRDVRQDVADVLVRYATGIDRRDWALLRSCFTDDCEADYGEIGGWHSADARASSSPATCGHASTRREGGTPATPSTAPMPRRRA
jgi:hypothetical protein